MNTSKPLATGKGLRGFVAVPLIKYKTALNYSKTYMKQSCLKKRRRISLLKKIELSIIVKDVLTWCNHSTHCGR